MTNSILLTAFLPIPEIVLKREHLRNQLKFLGWRDRLWTSLRTSLSERRNLITGAFIQGLGELRWRLKGPMLLMTVHQARLANDHGMSHRPPIPLVAHKTQRVINNGREYHLVKEIRVYPALFSQSISKLSSALNRPIPPGIIQRIASDFKESLTIRKQQLSRLLFGHVGEIAPSFSNYFTIRFNTRNNDERSQYTVKYTPEKNTIRITTVSNSKLFRERLTEAVSQAIAQRSIFPVLWDAFMRTSIEEHAKIRELVETLLISLTPTYYTHSNKLDPHILPWRYQRLLFETLSKKLGVDTMMRDGQMQFRDWLENMPLRDTLCLVDCSPPLGTKIGRAILRINRDSTEIDMKSPLKTLFDYLIIAYLHDRQIMDEDPTAHKISDDRLGMRTTNRIHRGMTRLERELDYQPLHRKDDLYEVPGPLLRQLETMCLIRSRAVQMTSASMGFRVIEDNPIVIRRSIELMNMLSPNDRAKLGE